MVMKKNGLLLGVSLLLLACGGGGGGKNAGDGGFQQPKEPELNITINPESIIPNPSSLAYEGLSSEAVAFVNIYAHQGSIPLENGKDELRVSLMDASKGYIYCFEVGDTCVKDKVRTAYGKVQLDLTAGRGMFAVTARDGKVGNIGINVTVVGANTRRSEDIFIPVKYTSSGKPHQISIFANEAIAPNRASSIAVTITDEAGNPVANPEKNNVIVTAGSLAGTTLGFQGKTGTSVYAKTNSGVANLTVLPSETGYLTLTAQTDIADNNVDNGIQNIKSTTKTIQVTNAQTTSTGDISILGTSLPTGVVGVKYDDFTIATSGSSLVDFAISKGSLPAGVTFSNRGVLSGTPLVAGQYTFSVTATGANGSKATQELTLTVVKGGFTFSRNSFDTITATRNDDPSKPDVCSLQGQILTLKASEGYTLATPFTWEMDANGVTTALGPGKDGIRAVSANGIPLPNLFFTVTDDSTQVTLNGEVCPNVGVDVFDGHAIILKAKDSNGFTYESILPLIISLEVNPYTPETLELHKGTVGMNYIATIPGAVSMQSSTGVPGLELDNTGALTGTPTQAGTFSFTVNLATGHTQLVKVTIEAAPASDGGSS